MIKELVVLKREDIDDIQELFEAVYPDRFLPEEYWEWCFDFPGEYIPMGIRSDDKLVGYHAYFCLGSSGMSTSAMTHPDFRGKGVWRPLAYFCFTELEKRGYNSLYLFSNKMIHPIHAKYGFEDICQIKEYRIPIDDIKINFGFGYYPKIYKKDSFELWRYKKHPLNAYIYYEKRDTKDHVIFSEYEDRIQIIDCSDLETSICLAVHIGGLLDKKFISFWSEKELDYPYIMIPTWLMMKNLNVENKEELIKDFKIQQLYMGMSDVY